jgi:predicted nucleic acid-binding protein
LENVNVDTDIVNVEDSLEKTPPNDIQRPTTNVILVDEPEVAAPDHQNPKEADLQLEDELNENFNGDKQANFTDSDESTQGSFVDATQHQLMVREDTNIGTVLSPVRVAKDMEFLKNSWANMMEEEEADKVLDDPGPSTNPNAGFQLVLSKNQRKGQKRTTVANRDSYTTRSKGTSKPFK